MRCSWFTLSQQGCTFNALLWDCACLAVVCMEPLALQKRPLLSILSAPGRHTLHHPLQHQVCEQSRGGIVHMSTADREGACRRRPSGALARARLAAGAGGAAAGRAGGRAPAVRPLVAGHCCAGGWAAALQQRILQVCPRRRAWYWRVCVSHSQALAESLALPLQVGSVTSTLCHMRWFKKVL